MESGCERTSGLGFETLENRVMLAAPAAQLLRLDGKLATRADVQVPSIWIVVPGYGGSPNTDAIRKVAAAVDGASTRDRVLMLDWRNTGKSLGGNADVTRIATAVQQSLQSWGVAAGQVNLVGYSLGAPIAAKVAQLINGRRQIVPTLVALDPGAPKNANPGGPDNGRPVYTFADKARFSIAFHSGSGYSFAPRAASAKVTVRVEGLGTTDLAKHENLPYAFASMVSSTNPGTSALAGPAGDHVSQYFSIARLNATTLWPWQSNRYNGMYEAIVTGSYAGQGQFSVKVLDFVGMAKARLRKVFA